MADFRIEGVVDLDSTRAIRAIQDFRKQLVLAGQEVSHLSRDIDNLGRKSPNIDINLDVQKALDEIQVIKHELDSINDEKVHVNIDTESKGTAETITELETVKKVANQVDGKTVKIDVDSSRAVKGLRDFTSEVANATTAIGGSGRGGLIASLVLLGTTLIPIGTVLTGWAAGAAGAFSVAGAGAAAFGAFAIPMFKEFTQTLKDMDKAQQAVDKAKNSGDTKKYNEALAQQKHLLASIPPEINKAVTAFQNLTKTQTELSRSMRPEFYSLLASGLNLLSSAMVKAKPAAEGVLTALTNIVAKAQSGLNGESWTKFFDYIGTTAGPMLEILTVSFGNIVTGIANVIVALDPLSQGFAGSFAQMSAKFLEWSKHLDTNQGFKNFVTYVQTNGPKVWDIIKTIATTGYELGKALEPLGMKVMTFVEGLLHGVQAFASANPGLAQFGLLAGVAATVLGPFASSLSGPLFGGLKSVGGILSGGITDSLGAFGGLLEESGLAAAIAGGGLESFAGPLMTMGSSLAAIAGPIGIVVVALTAIGVGLAFAHQSGAQFAPMMDAINGAFQVMIGVAQSVWQTLQGLWQLLKDTGTIAAFQEGIQSLMAAFQILAPMLGPIVQILGVALVGALWAVGQAFKLVAGAVEFSANIMKPLIQAIVAVFQWMFDVLVGHSIIPDLINAIGAWFGKLKGLVMGPVNAVKGALIAAWNAIKAATSATFNAIKSIVSSVWNGIKSVVTSVVNAVKSVVSGAWNAVRSATSSAFNAARSAASSAFNSLRSAVSSAASSARSAVTSAWNALKSVTSSVFNSMKSVVSSAVNNIGSTLRRIRGIATGALSGAGGWLVGAGRAIVSGLVSGINSMIGAVKGAVSNVMSAAKRLIPNSPAKEGPFSGRGWTLYSGKAIVRDLALGIDKSGNTAVSAVRGVMQDTQNAMQSHGNMSLTAGISANVADDSVVVSRGRAGGGGKTPPPAPKVINNNWTVNNPVAEKTSVTTNKTLRRASIMGLV